jgi:hypothetical protein
MLSEPESIERFIEDQAFSPSYDLAPPPTPPISKLSLFLSLPVCRLPSYPTGEEGGGGEEQNHLTAGKPGPL